MRLEGKTVWLVDGARTAFQRAGTGFGDAMAYQLGAAVLQGLQTRLGLEPRACDRICDRIWLGTTVVNARTTNVAREAALAAHFPVEIPAITIIAAGASANVAMAQAAEAIAAGQIEVAIAGATDCISDPPIGYRRAMRRKLLAARGARSLGQRLRFLLSLRPQDFLPDLPDVREFSSGKTMGEWTEALACELGILRSDQDSFAARSHRLARAAAPQLARQIVPFQRADGEIVDQDNGVRDEGVLARLPTLPPSFRPTSSRNTPVTEATTGHLTAGNSSFLTDGAAAVVLASDDAVRRWGWQPQARWVGHHLSAHDPHRELLLGPAFALPRLSQALGLGLDDYDVVEMHEAFAAQVLAVLSMWSDPARSRAWLGSEPFGQLPLERLNAWGGSLALGNPFAPNGARLVTTAAARLAAGGRRAAITTCAGGALGHAIVLERP